VARAPSFVPASTSADGDAAFTVERFKLVTPIAEAPWRQLQLEKVREVPLIHMSNDLDLRRLIRPSLPLPFPVNPLHLLGKYEPAGRRFFECALYPGILCSRRALFGLGRSLSVHIRTQQHTGRTPGKTARFLKCTEPRASRRVGQLVVTPWAAMANPDPSVGDGPTARSGGPRPVVLTRGSGRAHTPHRKLGRIEMTDDRDAQRAARRAETEAMVPPWSFRSARAGVLVWAK
jgi:hypothetical protein